MAKLCLQNLDDYEEHSQQARYYNGVMSLDKVCSFCEDIIPFEMLPKGGPCPLCNEYAMFIDLEE